MADEHTVGSALTCPVYSKTLEGVETEIVNSSGAVVYAAPSVVATSTGVGLDLTGNTALTTGELLKLGHATSVIADGGSMIQVASSGINTGGTTNGTLLDLKSTGQVAGVLVRLDNILTTGGAMRITGTGVMTTTGHLLALTANSATTAAGLFRIDGNGLTSGIGAVITSSATALTGAGRLLRVDHTGVSTTSGIIAEFASAAADETVIHKITASAALALGVACQVSAVAMTTGTAIGATDLDALTTGKGLHIASAATAITTTGRLIYSNHTGVSGTSATLNEFASAAADETVIFKVTASAALAAGVAVSISGAAVTTGTLLSAIDANGLTTGGIADFTSNSADVTARTLVNIKNDHASAVGAIPLKITQDAPTTTNFRLVMELHGINIYISNQNTPNAALSAPEGSLCLNGSATGQAFWNNDGSTGWTALA